MIKALSAICIAAFMAAAVTILPGFAPTVEARAVAVKGDRLDIRPVDCTTQSWPNFDQSCLRRVGSRTAVMTEARLVGTDRRTVE